MVGCRGNGVGPLRDHAGTGNIAYDLRPRQVSADARLGPLPHLDLNGRAGHQVVLVNTEPSGRHLGDGVAPIAVKVLVESALAGVIADPQRLRRSGQTFVGVEADGAVAHGGEQHRHGQLQLRRQLRDQPPLGIAPDALRLLAQKHPGLHRLPQRVDGRVRDLGGVEQQAVPVDRQFLGAAHRGQQHAAGGGLLPDLLHGIGGPVGALPQGAAVFLDLQSVGGTVRHAPLAVHTLALIRQHPVMGLVKAVNAVGTLLHTDLAVDAALRVPHHLKLRRHIEIFHQ